MKKHLLLFAFILAATALHAQYNDMYSFMYHERPGYAYNKNALLQQSDGDFIINTSVMDTVDYNLLGNVFYKLSSTTLTITDTLFIADTIMSPPWISWGGALWGGIVHNPNGDGCIRTLFEYHEDCDSCFLRISHFADNDLHSNPEEDVVSPVCEGYAYGMVTCVDHRGELILQYYKERDAVHWDEYLARFDTDGTMKCQALLHENAVMGSSGTVHLLHESPLKYYQWGLSEGSFYDNLVVHIIDTLCHKNTVIIDSKLSEENMGSNQTAYEFLYIDYDTEVIPSGEDEVLVAAKYIYEANHNHPMEYEYGVVVAKYDLRTMQPKGYLVFNDFTSIYRPAMCLGFKMMTDGTVYFLYKEDGYPDESFIAVKMDTDLNVEWKRFCKTDDIILYYLQHPVLCKDEQGEEKGIAWIGEAKKNNSNDFGFVFFYLNHDGTVGLDDGNVEVRPYTFYPNPAKEQVHLLFSPDVQPAQVQLYDLQGRLVRKQRNGFESIDMGQLPAGTYMMRVILEDGKAYADKVVKE